MALLYPPYLEGRIPSFYKINNAYIIRVLFRHNTTVGWSSYKGYKLKIKNIQSNTYITINDDYMYKNKELKGETEIVYEIPVSAAAFKVGQFYKIQLAYVDNDNNEGYYSTVAITKYIGEKPEVIIDQLKEVPVNGNLVNYVGKYTSLDRTETVYSYRFDVELLDGSILDTTDWLIHNSQNDTELGTSHDTYQLNKTLESNITYYIKYSVITNNGLEISSQKYRITENVSIDPEIKAELVATLNYENGYVDVKMLGKKNDLGEEIPATGAFLLSRASEDTGFTIWDEVMRFTFMAQYPSMSLFRDFTIEQGKTYKYALQQYNDNGLYSNRIKSNTLYADFEDAFLFDGTRQLKIKYNPKVSSFKTTLSESKVDTIGSKYPFIIRNGVVGYKEFPISGLISYMSDEEGLFDKVIEDRTHNLISSNIYNERQFKIKVLDWLNNGQPKLFKSPNEGNYIVRLMNISLSPEDKLGRMLHTFSATAYELDDYVYSNLGKYNFIQIEEPEMSTMCFRTVEFKDIENPQSGENVITTPGQKIYYIKFTDMIPGTIFYLNYDTIGEDKQRQFEIGITGGYEVKFDDASTVVSISMSKEDINANRMGSLYYGYKVITVNEFNDIKGLELAEVPTRQFFGAHDIIKEIEGIYINNKLIDNPKTELVKILSISAQLREIRDVYFFNNAYFKDPKHIEAITLEEMKSEPSVLYRVNSVVNNDIIGYMKDYPVYELSEIEYVDTLETVENYDTNLYYNGMAINLSEIQNKVIRPDEKPESLVSGNGINVDLTYQISNIEYKMEEENSSVKFAKAAYEVAYESYQTALETYGEGQEAQLEQERKEYINKYNIFITVLVDELEKERKAQTGE